MASPVPVMKAFDISALAAGWYSPLQMHIEMNTAAYTLMSWAKRNRIVDSPARLELSIIKWISLRLSASEPASMDPRP